MRSKRKSKNNKHRSRKYKGGNNEIIINIRKSLRTESDALEPILKNVFPNKNIQYVDFNSGLENVSVAYNSNNIGNTNIPMIVFVGESSNKIDKSILDKPNSLINIVGTQEPSILAYNNTVYLPNFVYVGPKKHIESPYKREFTNNERPRLAAYIASHSPEHRDTFFKALKALDETVDGLGNANRTKNIKLEGSWWDLSDTYKDYKFGFAMESVNEIGYISEKIMNVYRGGAIPLYWGTSKVKDIFHPDSFIYLNDYPSLDEAAKDVIAISKDEVRMNKMFNAPIFKENISPDYSKYYDKPSPQWVMDIANIIKNNLLKYQNGGILKTSKAYTVNLDKRNDRWENIKERFKDSSIELERVSAVIHEIPYTGCTLSYQKVVQMAKDNKLDTVLIFEDDNKPLDNFDIRWNTAKIWLDNNKDKWEIFNGSPKIEVDWDSVKVEYNLDNNVNLLSANMILNANWLYVNNSVYDKILNMAVDPNNLETSAFDRFVGDKKQYKTLFIYPFLSIQDNDYSNTVKSFINKDDEYSNMIKKLDKIVNKSQNGGRKNRNRKTKKLKQKGGNKKLIIKSGVWMGFFSNFNKLLTHLVDNPTITKIDYQMKSFGQGSPFSFIKEGEELFSKLFEPYDENKEISETLEKENYDDTRITGPGAANYYNENRTQLQPFHDAYKKYIKIKPEIQKKIDEKIKALKEGDPEKIIGIFIRSEALAGEQPSGKMPSREDYKRILDSIDKTKKTKYFLCIDNNDDLEYYKEHYKPNYYTNIRRTTNNTNGEPHKNTMGTLEELENSFIEVVLLSQCNILVHCLSNMVTASLYMNMNQESKFVQTA